MPWPTALAALPEPVCLKLAQPAEVPEEALQDLAYSSALRQAAEWRDAALLEAKRLGAARLEVARPAEALIVTRRTEARLEVMCPQPARLDGARLEGALLEMACRLEAQPTAAWRDEALLEAKCPQAARPAAARPEMAQPEVALPE